MRRKNIVVDSELNIVFKGGKCFTYKRVLEYKPLWSEKKFEITTKTFEGKFVKYLDLDQITSITEKLTRKIHIDERRNTEAQLP